MNHKHEASYRHGQVSTSYTAEDGASLPIEYGTCDCGAAVKRLGVWGESKAQNRRQYVTEFVSLRKAGAR